MIERLLDGLAQHAHDLVLIGALFAFLVAFFIVGVATLRFLEFLFPSLARWLDARLEPSIWDEQ